jgi:plastocyanin
MRLTRFLVAFFSLSLPIHALHADTDKGAVTGVVTFKVKMHSADPLLAETLATGPGNALANVVVYVSAGEAESSGGETNTVTFDQKGCYYSTHVLAVQTGQEIKISNSNPVSHNIHPMAKVNREWNRIQTPATPAFSYAYEKEEFIPVKSPPLDAGLFRGPENELLCRDMGERHISSARLAAE